MEEIGCAATRLPCVLFNGISLSRKHMNMHTGYSKAVRCVPTTANTKKMLPLSYWHTIFWIVSLDNCALAHVGTCVKQIRAFCFRRFPPHRHTYHRISNRATRSLRFHLVQLESDALPLRSPDKPHFTQVNSWQPDRSVRRGFALCAPARH